MSFSQHDSNEHRVVRRSLLFQLNDSTTTSIPPTTSDQPIPPENGSEVFPPNHHPGANNVYNEQDSRAKEYSSASTTLLPLSSTDGNNNFLLNTSHGVNNDVIIPIPDWTTALKQWGSWWDIHVFGSAVLFLALAVISVAIFVRFRDRVVRFQIVLNTLVLLATSGLFRAVFLLVDAYGHELRMSTYLVGIMTQAVYPLLCACFGLTQVMLVKVTNVDVGPKKFRSLSSLLGCTLGYLFLIVIIESIVYLEPHLKLLLLLDSGCFIAWSLYLTITFICSGFRLSQYTSETKKARKELNAFSIQRRSATSNLNTLSTISNSSNDACFSSIPPESSDVTQTTPHATTTDLSEETTSASFPSSSSCSFSNYAAVAASGAAVPHKAGAIRLSRPKMKIADHNHMTIAMVTDDDDESTSSTDVEQPYCDPSHHKVLHKSCTRNLRKRSSKSRPTKTQYKTKHDAAVERLLSLPNEKTKHDDKHKSFASNCINTTHTNRKNNTHPVPKHSTSSKTFPPEDDTMSSNQCDTPEQLQSFKLFQKSFHDKKDITVDMNTAIKSADTSPDGIHHLDTLGFHNTTAESNALAHSQKANRLDPESRREYSNHRGDAQTENNVLTSDISSSTKENGYLADTENAVVHSKTLRPTTKSRHSSKTAASKYDSADESSDPGEKDSSDCEDSDSTPPFSLSDRLSRDAPAIMSLFRIRQSKMVNRAVHLTYFLTFLFVFACLMQLYTVFGVYGVLGKVRRPHPWPWLIFHTIYRLLECSIGFTCAAIAFIALNYRHQRAKRRLQQQHHQQQQQQQQQQQHQQHHHSSDQNTEHYASLSDTRECIV